MPLLDHFHPPLSERRSWESFHSAWVGEISADLNKNRLPEYFFAEPTTHIGGQIQVDVATLDERPPLLDNGAKPVATLPKSAITSPPTWIAPAVFSDSFEVRVINTEGGPTLAAAIELVSPGNKDRPQMRRAFAAKCASLLCQGIPFIVIDIVTNRLANLHNEIMELMMTADCRLPAEQSLYATAYRPVRRDSREEIEIWHEAIQVGQPLPSLPLFVDVDFCVGMEFEASYNETCERLRLPV